jgi:shikimate dehydrogenase
LLHQTGFDYFYLPYKYESCETDSFRTIENTLKQSDFGGASITIPLKQVLLELMDYTSESVKLIGAMNTIVKLDNGQLYGDNTDWIAIYKLLDKTLHKSIRSSCNFLIIGAGGVARAALYALKQLQITATIFLYNPRNPEKAKEFVKDNVVAVSEQSSLVNQNIRLIISTLPATSKFIFEENFLFQENNLPIIFDVNYVPYNTHLIKQAQKFNCHIIRGIDMFIEQGLEQFQLWTNKVSIINSLLEQTVRHKYNELYIQSSQFETN